MFPNKISKTVSAIILKDIDIIFNEISQLQAKAIINSKDEVSYFRNLFPDLKKYLNSNPIFGVTFKCEANEIHQKPIVKFNGKRCELGDYFINVKYFRNNTIIGRKCIIYQFKIEEKNKSSWKIDQTQLELLKDWPPFTFGRKNAGYQTFDIEPGTKEFGSYWLSQRSQMFRNGFDLVASSFDIAINQNNKKISDISVFPFSGTLALIFQLSWLIGELIQDKSEIDKLVEALYRYVGFAPDPPDEFNDFMTTENEGKVFWGVEICVNFDEEKLQYYKL